MIKPLVSIIIPVYNGSNFIQQAIESALNQTYANIEVIVVNDGSNDNGATEKIALSYGDKIRYISKPNGGVATALNVGIKEMKGEYFSWLSHDDLYYPEKVEQQIKALVKNGNMESIVYSDYDILEEKSGIITSLSLKDTYSNQQLSQSVFPVLQGIIHGCTLLIHKSHFERVGGFDEQLVTTQDYDLWFKMFRKQNLIYLDQTLVTCRVHGEQGSRTIESHDKERNELYINMMNQLTEMEMVAMFGSSYNFYHRMSCFFKGGNMKESYQYANNKFQTSQVPQKMVDELNDLKEEIYRLSNKKAEKICIFCAGQWGIRLYHEMKSKLIKVDCFADNDPRKWGYMFNDVVCISADKLKEQKDNTLVIVAARASAEIVEQLKLEGFPYVVTKQDIDKVMMQVPPVKWVTALESISGLDYSSTETQSLINKFNEVIFDICKYYQDKTKDS